MDRSTFVQPLDRPAFERLLLAPDLALLGRAIRAGELDELFPELRREMDFPQRTPYHHLSNLDHSLLTAQLMPADLESRLTGLLHDIGKRTCRVINPRTGHEQYIGHGPVGARQVRAILARLGYSSELVVRISGRIYLHMDLHIGANNARSEKSLDKLLEKVGPDLEALYCLQLADIGAMNPTIRDLKLAEARESYGRLLRRRGGGR